MDTAVGGVQPQELPERLVVLLWKVLEKKLCRRKHSSRVAHSPQAATKHPCVALNKWNAANCADLESSTTNKGKVSRPMPGLVLTPVSDGSGAELEEIFILVSHMHPS